MHIHRSLLLLFVGTPLLAQVPELPTTPPSTPMVLPPVVLKHDPTIEEVLKFSPDRITHKKVEGIWGIWAGDDLLKEMPSEKMAKETAELMQQYGMNQRLRVPGSHPPFELWLKDGAALRPTSLRRVVLYITPDSFNLREVSGMWCINDGTKTFYNFGKDETAAKRAIEIWNKHKFNQIGIQGAPNPALVFPMFDPFTDETYQKQKKIGKTPKPMVDELSMAHSALKSGLVIPALGYIGPKLTIDTTNAEGVATKDSYEVIAGEHKIARVTTDRHAKDNARFFQNSHANEMAQLGKGQHVLYLKEGQPLRGYTSGVSSITFLYDRIKAVEISKVWYVCEDNRPIAPCLDKEDAELVAAVLRFYKIDSMTTLGDPKKGGRYLFLRR